MILDQTCASRCCKVAACCVDSKETEIDSSVLLTSGKGTIESGVALDDQDDAETEIHFRSAGEMS